MLTHVYVIKQCRITCVLEYFSTVYKTACTQLYDEWVVQGVAFPAFVAMLAKWAPPREKSTMTAAMFAGMFSDNTLVVLLVRTTTTVVSKSLNVLVKIVFI